MFSRSPAVFALVMSCCLSQRSYSTSFFARDKNFIRVANRRLLVGLSVWINRSSGMSLSP